MKHLMNFKIMCAAISLLALYCLFFQFSALAEAMNDQISFYMEEEGGTLPNAVVAALAKTSPYTAAECHGFHGKKLKLSDKETEDFYAASASAGPCFGSAGTPLWIVRFTQGKAKVMIEQDGAVVSVAPEVHDGMHDLKFTEGSAGTAGVAVWSYVGGAYKKVSQKIFDPSDCNDPVKKHDPDMPWVCE